MIRKSLIEFIFEAASIQRWNDHIRPSRGFAELDKQSHKMICAYILGKLDGEIDWLKLVEGGIFEFLHRLVLTDIKPPVFHKLMEKKGKELNAWAIKEIMPEIQSISGGFADRFIKYFTDENYSIKEKKILEAAHYTATKWEFDIIYDMCHNYYGIENTRREIDSKIENLLKLPCYVEYMKNNNYQGFVDLLGELRFQQRWSRSPRIPETSVIGHMMVVATLSYLCSCETGACDKRKVNNFFGGLFHDVPEVLTRDIVSPVKNSVEGLDDLIKDIEREQMEDVLYPLISDEWKADMSYYTEDEFDNKVIVDNKILVVSDEEICQKYNKDEYSPIDGRIIRGCDHLAACVETYTSHTSGVSTHILRDANNGMCANYKNSFINGIDFGCLFDYFRI